MIWLDAGGGEEFVGIYSISKPYDAPILAEKFRQLIAHTEVPHEGKCLAITVSVGVTVLEPSDTIESVIERADHLMYKSKTSGKNRITST